MTIRSAPPEWAQSIVELVTAARDRDNVLGDLLGEYSESVAPERGQSAADRWYAWQAARLLWRASLPAGIALCANLVGRMLIDMAAPTLQTAERAAITTYMAIAILAMWGFRTGRSTGRALSGALVGFAAAGIAAMAAMLITLLIGGLGGRWIRPNPAAWAALVEGLDVPLLPMLVIGGVVSTLAAAAGSRFKAPPQSRSSVRT